MSETLRRIITLALAGDIDISDHGFDELRSDDILPSDAVLSIAAAVLIEEYWDRRRVLALQHDVNGQAIHVVWGLPAGARRPAVLVTAYRPDPELWDETFMKRRS